MPTEQLESAQREQGVRKKASRCRQTADFERNARRALILIRYFPYWESSGSKGSPNEMVAS